MFGYRIAMWCYIRVFQAEANGGDTMAVSVISRRNSERPSMSFRSCKQTPLALSFLDIS
jgi:hypothetical protein